MTHVSPDPVATLSSEIGHGTPMIRLASVEKVYRTDKIETLALAGIDLEIQNGEFVSIMGPSGCGKSTLLNIIGLLDAPSAGTLQVAGRNVHEMRDNDLARLRNERVGFIFHSIRFFGVEMIGRVGLRKLRADKP